MQLENRVSTLRTQYQQISENLLKAQNSARMATEQRAERLSLVEPAIAGPPLFAEPPSVDRRGGRGGTSDWAFSWRSALEP